MKRKKEVKKLICLDMDNTLLHSHKAHIVAYQKALKKLGYKNITNKQIEAKFGIQARTYLKQLIPNITENELDKIKKIHDQHLAKAAKRYVHKVKGALGVLKQLKKEYQLALITNCRKYDVDVFLKKAKIPQSIFDAITPSTKNTPSKPAPDQIIKTEKKLKTKAEFMVGDTVYDIIAAKRAKVKAIAVTSGLQSRAKLKKEKPYAVLKSIKELPKFLKKIQK